MKNLEFKRPAAGTLRMALLVVGVLGTALCASGLAQAQEANATTASPGGQTIAAYLDYRELNYSVITWGLQVSSRSSAFKKEPVFSGGKIIRGTLQLGGGTNDELGFAWDRSARKLYLDLNRNLDLTDDPAGVFSCATGFNENNQFFNNVPLPFNTLVGTRPMLADLSFYDFGRLNCNAAMRSLFQGKVTLQGAEWQVGVLANPLDQRGWPENGHLLLRPWADRNNPFSLYSGTLEAVPFSRNLFVGGHAYQLYCTNAVQGDVAKVRVQFAEQQPKLGELKITGEFVQRVTLEGGPYLVVLDKPAAVVRVPVGRYASAKVCLKKGDMQACLDPRTQAGLGHITVSEGAPVVLTAGGPLTNSVSINRQGRKLVLNYQLVGAGGAYQMAAQDRSHPPEFAVYQGDKKVGSGKFEFG